MISFDLPVYLDNNYKMNVVALTCQALTSSKMTAFCFFVLLLFSQDIYYFLILERVAGGLRGEAGYNLDSLSQTTIHSHIHSLKAVKNHHFTFTCTSLDGGKTLESLERRK